MRIQQVFRYDVPTQQQRRPVSQYELARMVVMVLQDFVRTERAFTACDVTAEVRRRHPDCEIFYHDRTWDGTTAPWEPGEPYRRGHVAIRGVQSLVPEIMSVHLADEYTCRTVRVSPERYTERYLPLRDSTRRIKQDRWGDAA